jgi:RNA polymerase sigma-70 factor (ECF subfamily)
MLRGGAFRLSIEPRPAEKSVTHSSDESSGSPPDPDKSQLSASDRVQSDVSSVALDLGRRGGLLPLAGQNSRPPAKELKPEADAAAGAEPSDADMMLRVKGGDDSAFDFLVQKYRRPMISFMYRMAHNSAAAEDLAQDVFLRVYRSREGYEASAKFTTWLYRIATNLAVNHARDHRHERPEAQVSLDEPDEETGSTLDVPDRSLSAEEKIIRRERMAAIRQKVQALPERQRVAVLMHKYQQMDYRQIAEVLKLSESATKSLLFRAYEALRAELKEFL